MRLVVQRVRSARVRVDQEVVGEIEHGLLVFAGFGAEDVDHRAPRDGLAGSRLWEKMLGKLLGLRIFSDEAGKMNRSVQDADGGILVVSQFTLHADCRKGMRPSFANRAAPPAEAEALYHRLVADLRARARGPVQTGRFGSEMQVELINAGPVTILLDSEEFASS